MVAMKKAAMVAELAPQCGTRVEIAGEKILLVRDGDEIFAYAAECPHAGAPLEQGVVCDGRIICPWHKAAFDLRSGALLEPPALDGLARYPVRVENGIVCVAPRRTQGRNTTHQGDPDDARTMVIVGNGAAGTCAAATLREAGFSGRIVLIGREPGPAYDRTVLSKFVMSAEMAPDDVPALQDTRFPARQRIQVETAEVVRLDVPARKIELRDGRRLHYAAALVATGGVPRRPDIPGADLRGIHVLRSREDAAAIARAVHAGTRVAILGNSFIGLEVASGLRKRRADVTVVAPQAVPFAKQFGAQLGARLKQLHEQNGVVFRQANVERFTGSGSGPSNVSALVLEGGESLSTELVVLGTGVRPATGFIVGQLLEEDGGLAVDAGMHAADGLYAAGDIAAMPLPHTGGRGRIEHWRVAQQQARIAAHNMLGARERFVQAPFFWTYHYGKRFDYLGHADTWDEVLIDGDLAQLEFVALLACAGQVVAALACARERAMALLSERMRAPLELAEALRIVRAAP